MQIVSKLMFPASLILLVFSVGLNFVLAEEIKGLRRNIGKLKSETSIKPGDSVPDISGVSPERVETIFRFKDDTRSTVVYFFSPRCSWCVKNRELFAKLHSSQKDRFRWVAVSLDTTNVEEFVRESNMAMPVLSQVPDEVLDSYKIEGTPQTFVVASDGRVLKKWVGSFTGSVGAEMESFFGSSLQ